MPDCRVHKTLGIWGIQLMQGFCKGEVIITKYANMKLRKIAHYTFLPFSMYPFENSVRTFKTLFFTMTNRCSVESPGECCLVVC